MKDKDQLLKELKMKRAILAREWSSILESDIERLEAQLNEEDSSNGRIIYHTPYDKVKNDDL